MFCIAFLTCSTGRLADTAAIVQSGTKKTQLSGCPRLYMIITYDDTHASVAVYLCIHPIVGLNTCPAVFRSWAQIASIFLPFLNEGLSNGIFFFIHCQWLFLSMGMIQGETRFTEFVSYLKRKWRWGKKFLGLAAGKKASVATWKVGECGEFRNWLDVSEEKRRGFSFFLPATKPHRSMGGIKRRHIIPSLPAIKLSIALVAAGL